MLAPPGGLAPQPWGNPGSATDFHLPHEVLMISDSKNLNNPKYQGVKEFHMLARISCYCNIMVFSPFKVKVTYSETINHS